MDYGMDILVRNFMERISRYSRPKFQAQDLNPNVQYLHLLVMLVTEIYYVELPFLTLSSTKTNVQHPFLSL